MQLNLFVIALQTQEKEAKREMQRRSKELAAQRKEANKEGRRHIGFGGSGSSYMRGGGSSGGGGMETVVDPVDSLKQVTKPAK